MMRIEDKLKEMGYTLPETSAPKGNYLPFRKAGNLLYLSGVLSAVPNGDAYQGKVGESQTVETGYEAARACALNALASARSALGDLERIEQLVFVNGYVNALPGFPDSPKVINGASDFFVELLGDAGKHARAALAVTGLPNDATVELQVVLEFA